MSIRTRLFTGCFFALLLGGTIEVRAAESTAEAPVRGRRGFEPKRYTKAWWRVISPTRFALAMHARRLATPTWPSGQTVTQLNVESSFVDRVRVVPGRKGKVVKVTGRIYWTFPLGDERVGQPPAGQATTKVEATMPLSDVTAYWIDAREGARSTKVEPFFGTLREPGWRGPALLRWLERKAVGGGRESLLAVAVESLRRPEQIAEFLTEMDRRHPLNRHLLRELVLDERAPKGMSGAWCVAFARLPKKSPAAWPSARKGAALIEALKQESAAAGYPDNWEFRAAFSLQHPEEIADYARDQFNRHGARVAENLETILQMGPYPGTDHSWRAAVEAIRTGGWTRQ